MKIEICEEKGETRLSIAELLMRSKITLRFEFFGKPVSTMHYTA